jgi:hypothetical protein
MIANPSHRLRRLSAMAGYQTEKGRTGIAEGPAAAAFAELVSLGAEVSAQHPPGSNLLCPLSVFASALLHFRIHRKNWPF